MATNYGERIRAVEENTKNIEKKLDYLVDKFDDLEQSFVTRNEFNIAKWLITLGFSVVGVVLGVLSQIGA